MQVSRGLDRVGVDFDDEHLVANAGLIAPASLAQHLGLRELIEDRVDLGDAPGRANVGHKAMTVVHAVLVGADSIDDCEVLRSGATAAVLGHAVLAPSTIGTFLRSFSWAHARQLDSVAAEATVRAWAAGAGPAGSAEPFTIDMDSSVHETYGLQKEGATRFTYTHVRGYHPLYAMAGDDGEVLHSRLRGGSSHTARGAAGFLAETFSRVRAGGVSGPLKMRADSGFYSKKVVDACKKAGVGFSITVKLYKNVHAAISKIPEDAWTPIPYWLEQGADVAAIDWHAFGPGPKGVDCRLVVRRVRPTPGSHLLLPRLHHRRRGRPRRPRRLASRPRRLRERHKGPQVRGRAQPSALGAFRGQCRLARPQRDRPQPVTLDRAHRRHRHRTARAGPTRTGPVRRAPRWAGLPQAQELRGHRHLAPALPGHPRAHRLLGAPAYPAPPRSLALGRALLLRSRCHPRHRTGHLTAQQDRRPWRTRRRQPGPITWP